VLPAETYGKASNDDENASIQSEHQYDAVPSEQETDITMASVNDVLEEDLHVAYLAEEGATTPSVSEPESSSLTFAEVLDESQQSQKHVKLWKAGVMM
ncbi:hypothetical protein C0993_009181, partial [Termitomyces sp. T159_Od127]